MNPKKCYGEVLQDVMLQHGVLQKTGPDEYRVVSKNLKKIAACFEQTERALVATPDPDKGLIWKDRNGDSEARAARENGGDYRIVRVFNSHYEVKYRRHGSRDWEDILEYPLAILDTLAEAKRMAEVDHVQRRRGLLSDDETIERIHNQQLAAADPGEPD